MMILFLSLVLCSSPALAQIPDLHVNQRGFADDLTATLYVNENECTSALGVSMAFSLVYPSMTGASLNQTRSVLGYPASASDELAWQATQNQLGDMYTGSCLIEEAGECSLQEPTVVISNIVWVDIQRTLDPDFAAVVGDSVALVDFTDEGVGDQVNAWVNNATRGLIDELVDPGPLSPLVLLAINAIYLKANWGLMFSSSFTNQDVFYTSASKTISANEEANFMHQVAFFPYSDQTIPGFQILQLPFGSGQGLSMVIALPLSDDSGVVLSSELIVSAIPQLQSKRLAIAIPKFELELVYRDSLKSALQAMGIEAPFLGGLCIFENDCAKFIEFVIQKTFISVDEDGVEAAAVTAIGVRESAPIDQPIEVLVDHSFQFFIYEENTQLVLFEGRLGNPGLQDDSAQLAARHIESDFWTSNFGVDPITVDVPPPSSTSPAPSTLAPTLANSTPTTLAPVTSAPVATSTSSALARLRSTLLSPSTLMCLAGTLLL